VDRIERWIKQKLASVIAAGVGQWADSPGSALGKPIYQVKDGSVTLVLSQLGFKYEGPTPPIECRYDEVEAIKLAPLTEIMRLRGDLNKMLPLGVILRGAPERLEMQWPLRVYSNVATVLERIVRELT